MLGLFSVWVYPQIEGRQRADAKPRVVLNNYSGAVARIFKRDYKLPMPQAKHWEGEVKGLLRSYQKIYGTLALGRAARQPMTREMWARIEALQPGAAIAGRRVWMLNRHDDMTVLRLGRVLWKTGHRLGEIVRYSEDEITYLTREHVSYRIGGVTYTDPPAERLRAMKRGDLILLAPCASKADQFGEAHSPFPSVIEFDGTSTCAAASIRDIELERPCHGSDRARLPLFGGRPFTYGTLNRLLHQIVAGIFGEAVASTVSWHSFRIGLAMALRAADCPDEQIQLICRWQCRESLQAYAQLGTSKHILWLRRAANVSVEGVRTANLPALDNSAAYAEILDPQEGAAAGPAQGQRASPAMASPLRPAARPALLLNPGDRIEVKWGDRFFAGAYTSSRMGLNCAGTEARLYRIYYDAVEGWRAQRGYHDLNEVEWRRLP